MQTKQNLFKIKIVLVASYFLCLTLLAGGYQPSFAQSDEGLALLDRTSKGFASVVKKAGPAVVHIEVEKTTSEKNIEQFPPELFDDPFFKRFFGPQFQPPRNTPRQDKPTFKQQVAGSGFIITSDGYILTNNHVVDGASKITVRLADERVFPAKVIGTDPPTDVAIIKIEGKDLPVLPLGNSDALEVGEWVLAIGSPFDLNQTVTVGVVSALGRNRVGISDYENFIQTDAAINPGNSGGPLLNIHGEAVGMNTAIFSRSGGYMGVGFAIPINMVKSIEQQLRKNGKVLRGYLGVIVQDVSEKLAKSFGQQTSGGALISEVAKGSPGNKSGLMQGDIITTINSVPVINAADLHNKIAMTPPNTDLTLRILRDGKEKELVVTVGEQPANMKSLVKQMTSTPLHEMGLTLQDLTADVAKQFGYTKDQGVLIANVDPDSPAALVGLQAGQLVEEVNRIRVHSLNELREAMKKSSNPKQVLLLIRSGENSEYVVLQTD